ncbi:ATP-grasp domain-containing protein [Balneola sp. MJW-20]|uniref:ATP-grasp domain-containing protein n=1 Tax=Gracilimonas aurantiaca TaxID=3234185 RepID=UPI003466B23A
MSLSVLILGTGDNLALSAVRLLGLSNNNMILHALSHSGERFNVPEYSRYISSKNTYSSDLNNSKEFGEELLNIVHRTGADIIIPTDEQYIVALSSIASMLDGKVIIPRSVEAKEFNRLIYKNELHDLLKECGLETPWTVVIDENKSVVEYQEYLPALVKPVHLGGGYGIQMINSVDELEEYLKSKDQIPFVNPDDSFILQELIPGYNIDCSLLADKGRLVAVTVQRAIAEPGYQYPTAIEFLESELITDYAEKLIERTGFSGLAHLDFRMDERDHQPKLIDFNARVWRSMIGSKEAGVNFMELWVDTLLGKETEKPEVRTGEYYMKKNALKGLKRQWSGRASDQDFISTDLKYRLRDPLPEVVAIWSRVMSRFI